MALRRATDMPKLCPHDLRHLSITRLLEAGVEPEIVRSLAGHVSRQMMEYYSHVRMEPKLKAVERIDLPPRKPPARELGISRSEPLQIGLRDVPEAKR